MCFFLSGLSFVFRSSAQQNSSGDCCTFPSGVFRLRKPPLVSQAHITRGGFLIRENNKGGAFLFEKITFLGSVWSRCTNRINSAAGEKIFSAAGDFFWESHEKSVKSLKKIVLKHAHLKKFACGAIWLSSEGNVVLRFSRIRKPPLVSQTHITRGGFLIAGGFLNRNTPDCQKRVFLYE